MTDPNLENILNWSGVSAELYPLNYIKIREKIIKNHPKKFKEKFVTLFSFGFRKGKRKRKFAIWHDGLFIYEPGTETVRYGRIFKKEKQLIVKKVLLGTDKSGAYFISYAIPVILSMEKIYLTCEFILNKKNYDYIIKRVGHNQMYIREVFYRALSRYPEIKNMMDEIIKKNPFIDRFPLQEKDTSIDEINRLYDSK